MSDPGANQSDEQRAKEVQEANAMMVCYTKISPRSCCNTDGPFVRLINALNPSLIPYFTFESLERNCLKVYKTELDKVKDIFSKHGGQISLSVDLLDGGRCGSVNQYLSLCAHFIDDHWKLRNWVIKYCCVYAVGMDTPYDAILKALKEYDIEGKISTLTVGGTGDLADLAKENVQERRNFLLNGQLFHLQCIGYVISVMVQEGFEEISEIIDKVRCLSWSNSSPLWYLTSSKLSDALELNDLGEFAPEQIGDSYKVPSLEEWEKVRTMCKIAERIYEITKGLFDIKRPATNLFLPHLQEIRAYLGQQSTNSDAFGRNVAQKMLKIFNKHWDDMCLVLSIAAFLDPRFKMNFVEFCLSDDSRASYVLKSICKLYDGYTVQCDEKEDLLSNPNIMSESNLDSDSDSDSDDEEDEEEDDYEEAKDEEDKEEDEQRTERRAKKKRVTNLGNLNIVQEYCQSMQSTSYKPRKTDLVHLDMYLEEPVLPWVEDFSVLQWWKDNSSKYPQLSKMARDFLAMPMSVASSYDAYYTEPREADRTLLSLKPELTNALKCTRSWKLGRKMTN